MSQKPDPEKRDPEDSQNISDSLWSDEYLESQLAAIDELNLKLEEDLATNSFLIDDLTTDPLLLEDLTTDSEELDFSWLSSDIDLTLDLGELDFREESQETVAPPNPHLTAQDIAEWMKQQIENHGQIHQRRVVSYVTYNCDDKFIHRNKNNNPALDKAILENFLVLTKDTVVWVRKKYYWRKRREGDPPSRRVDD